MPETITSIGTSLLRIVFRGGSPERIRYSDRLLLGALCGSLTAFIVVERAFFASSLLETGLGLFTLLCGVYLGSALLSRRVARMRLRIALQSLWLLLLSVLIVLIVLIPLVRLQPELRIGVGIAAGAVLLLGLTSVVHYVRRGSRGQAAMTSLAFAAVLGTFHATLSALLQVLFS